MTHTFPEVKEGQVGLYTGIIASSFALAQFATNFFWGWLSDRIGRKPVIIIGTALTAASFVAFGFCRTLWQAILVQAFMGLVNGNQGIVSTCLGEITDRSNQSKAFTYLPVVYGIGAITGPIVGGVLVLYKKPFSSGDEVNPLPYLLPNLFSAAVLIIDLIICMLFLEESHEEAKNLPPLGKRIGNMFAWLWQFTTSTRPTYIRRLMRRKDHHSHHHHEHLDGIQEVENEGASDAASEDSGPHFFPDAPTEQLSRKEVLNRDTMLLLGTYFLFQLANIAFNSLYPVFAEELPPTGRGLKPKSVGVSLAFAGVITILFQVGIYSKLRDRVGNKATYRVSLAAFVIAFALMPFMGYKDSQPPLGIGSGFAWLWGELGVILVIKTVASVGGLSAALLLVSPHMDSGWCRPLIHVLQVTNSAPNNNVLGTLNGLAQTLSAAGRAVGPFISGALFTAATRFKHKGEALPFGTFAGITLIGFLLSYGIRGGGLEAEGWSSGEESGEEEDEEDSAGEGQSENERTGLLRK
jgi:MFS family permease